MQQDRMELSCLTPRAYAQEMNLTKRKETLNELTHDLMSPFISKVKLVIFLSFKAGHSVFLNLKHNFLSHFLHLFLLHTLPLLDLASLPLLRAASLSLSLLLQPRETLSITAGLSVIRNSMQT